MEKYHPAYFQKGFQLSMSHMLTVISFDEHCFHNDAYNDSTKDLEASLPFHEYAIKTK